MSRSLKKLFIGDFGLLNNIKLKNYNFLEDLNDNINNRLKKKLTGKIFFILKKKNIVIESYMIGLNFIVYNGKTFFFINIKQNMVGFKIGEFLLTKILGSDIHIDKKKRRNKNIK
jgi:ribosomal protein S19